MQSPAWTWQLLAALAFVVETTVGNYAAERYKLQVLPLMRLWHQRLVIMAHLHDSYAVGVKAEYPRLPMPPVEEPTPPEHGPPSAPAPLPSTAPSPLPAAAPAASDQPLPRRRRSESAPVVVADPSLPDLELDGNMDLDDDLNLDGLCGILPSLSLSLAPSDEEPSAPPTTTTSTTTTTAAPPKVKKEKPAPKVKKEKGGKKKVKEEKGKSKSKGGKKKVKKERRGKRDKQEMSDDSDATTSPSPTGLPARGVAFHAAIHAAAEAGAAYVETRRDQDGQPEGPLCAPPPLCVDHMWSMHGWCGRPGPSSCTWCSGTRVATRAAGCAATPTSSGRRRRRRARRRRRR